MLDNIYVMQISSSPVGHSAAHEILQYVMFYHLGERCTVAFFIVFAKSFT